MANPIRQFAKMGVKMQIKPLHFNTISKWVVDRGGFAFTNESNAIQLAHRPFSATADCRVPHELANLNGPMRDANLTPALTTTERRGSIMADYPTTTNPRDVERLKLVPMRVEPREDGGYPWVNIEEESLVALYDPDGALREVLIYYGDDGRIWPERGENNIRYGGRWDDATVYFAGVTSGEIKIGLAKDVASRISTMQTGNHLEIAVLAVTSGGVSQERAYHRLFAEHRIRGEWFRPHSDILAEIERLSANSLQRAVQTQGGHHA